MTAYRKSEDSVLELKNLVLKERRAVGFPSLRRKVVYTQGVYELVSKALSQPGVTAVRLSAETGLSIGFITKYRHWEEKKTPLFREMSVIHNDDIELQQNAKNETEKVRSTEKINDCDQITGRLEFPLPFGFRLILKQNNKQHEVGISFVTGSSND